MAQIISCQLALLRASNLNAEVLKVPESTIMRVSCSLLFFPDDARFIIPSSTSEGKQFGNNFSYIVEIWKQVINFQLKPGHPARIQHSLLISATETVKPTPKNFQGAKINKITDFLTHAVFHTPALPVDFSDSVFGVIRLVNNSDGNMVSASTNLKPDVVRVEKKVRA